MSKVGSLISPLLVGRDDLLELADRRIAEAAVGRGHLLLLAGEAGIGKTRLMNSILRKALLAGFRMSKGDVGPHDQQVPLAPILDLARSLRDDAAFGTLGRDLLALRGGHGGDALGSRRLLVQDVADRILEAVDGPTALAFADLQWADELSLEIIGELSRRARERPLLLLADYRLDELAPASFHREWRARLLGQRLAEEARLERLTYDQTALVTTLILATGLPAPREVVDAVHQRSNGIPFHIEELLAAVDPEARADGAAIRRVTVPDTIEDAIHARMARLSDEAREVARAGAVMGRCFVPEVLAGLLDRPPAHLDRPLEELVAASILYPFDFLDRGFYDFRHQLLRDALYGTVPPRELRRLHARAAEFGALIEGASEIHASVHYERAGLCRQAYRSALAGARDAMAMSSRREAFELFARAAANIPEDLPPLERAELYDAYSEAAFAIDNVGVAEHTARQARDWYLEAGRPIAAATQLVMLANMARRDVRPAEERRSLLDAADAELDRLPPSPERSAVLALQRQLAGIDAIDEGNLDLARERFAEALRLGDEGGLPDEGDRDFYGAMVDALEGRTSASLDTLIRVARRARDLNFESTGVTAFRVSAVLAARVMDYRRAEAAMDEGLRYADAIQQSYCRRVMAATSALVAWARGRWDEAVAAAELELVDRGSRRGTLGSRHALGYVAVGRGEFERARTLLDEALALGRPTREAELILPPLWGMTELELLDGRPDLAVAHAAEALALAETVSEGALLVPFLVSGVRALLADRRPEDARRWLDRAAPVVASWPAVARPALDHAEGLLRTAAGSTVAARESLEAAVRGWDEVGRTWEAAWARFDLARCLARGNRVAAALEMLAEARTHAQRLGSPPLLDRIDELTRDVRGRDVDDEPWRPLTAREFEVARLIAAGLTNGEIAAELSIATRTASAHVEHILAKLGLARRSEVAAWASRIDRGGSGAGAAGSSTPIPVGVRGR